VLPCLEEVQLVAVIAVAAAGRDQHDRDRPCDGE
jgi:hypothetical protein